jgi:hypothetical protein
MRSHYLTCQQDAHPLPFPWLFGPATRQKSVNSSISCHNYVNRRRMQNNKYGVQIMYPKQTNLQ